MFISTIHVEEDGSARISEKITFVFVGEYHGVYRDIPVDYPGPNGTNYSLFIKIDSITGDDGAPLKYEKHTSGGYLKLKIYVPDAINVSRTVNIEYSVANATKFFDDHDEFYWNVTGNDWPVPMDHVATSVYFPDKASGGLRAQAFSGPYGSANQEKTVVAGNAVMCETADALPMHSGLSIDVYVPQGLLQRPGLFTRAGWFLRSNPILTLPLYTFLVMFAFWWLKGRDPDPGMSVAPMYEPPENMGPAETGTLIDDSVDARDITSVLVDLAVRGYVKIVETTHKGLLLNHKDFELHLLKGRNEWKDLNDYEQTMLNRVFYSGTVTRLSDLKNRFYTAIPKLKSQIMSALKQKGMYSVDPNSAAGYWGLAAVLIAAPYALLEWSGKVDFFNSGVMAFISIGVAIVICIIIGRQLTAKSPQGVKTLVEIQGFQEFMNRVDADRLKRMPPDTFEKYLPYAMALGVEQHWAKAFEGIVQTPPSWYESSGGYIFSPYTFVNSVSYMSQQAHSAFVAAPRSSSSSSGWSGGGGFSGGGFGGGGGGAF